MTGAGQVPAQTTYGVIVAPSSGALSFSTERQVVPDGKVRLSVMSVSCVAFTPPLSGTFGLGQAGWTVVWVTFRPPRGTAACCTSWYPAGEPQMAQVVPKASVADVLSNTTFHEYWVCVPINFLLGYVLAIASEVLIVSVDPPPPSTLVPSGHAWLSSVVPLGGRST